MPRTSELPASQRDRQPAPGLVADQAAEAVASALDHSARNTPLDELLRPLRGLARAAGPAHGGPASAGCCSLEVAGRFQRNGATCEIPRVRLVGPPAGHDAIPIAICAGIHGDEPAGCAGLVNLAAALAQEPARAAGYDLFMYPVVNPTGYIRGTRVNDAGRDLNREFWRQSPEAEVQIMEAELRANRFAGIITLHADDTCEGIYGYAHGRTLNEALLTPALAAAGRFLPVDTRAIIDGFPARAGLIGDCFDGVLSAAPDQQPRPFDLIFETPAHARLELQVAATVAALESILATYPGFIAYAQDI